MLQPRWRTVLALVIFGTSLALAAPASRPGAAPAGGKEIKNAKDGSVLVRIPAGPFTMGSTNESDEKPVSQVTLPDYYIGKVPVTNAQFRRFVKATHPTLEGDWESYASKWGETAPVVEVSFSDAVAYCTWAGLRLPTEGEWEKAARGPDGRKYPWGNTWDTTRSRNSVGGQSPGAVKVGSYPSGASPYGCLDMAGNVWQWCASMYLRYPYKTDAPAPVGRVPCILRGGSWNISDANYFRTSCRNSNAPVNFDNDAGFRVARNP